VILQTLIAAPVGAVVGSFSATAGLRWARGEQSVSGRSRCDACAAPLGLAATVPIFAYVRLGGVCAGCRAPIHRGHLVGEVLGATTAAISFLMLPIEQALALAVLAQVLIAAATADVACRRLPNLATIMVAALCLGLALQRGPSALIAGVVAAIIAGGALLALRSLFKRSRGGEPGLGLGDVKLVAALGLWLGAAAPWAIAVAGLLGLAQVRLAKPADGKIAFGPALAASGWAIGLLLQAGLLGELLP